MSPRCVQKLFASSTGEAPRLGCFGTPWWKGGRPGSCWWTHPTGHLSDGCRLSYMAAGIASQGLGGPGVLELEVVLDTCICSCTYIWGRAEKVTAASLSSGDRGTLFFSSVVFAGRETDHLFSFNFVQLTELNDEPCSFLRVFARLFVCLLVCLFVSSLRGDFHIWRP